jgi:hypothetical protein
MYDYVDIGPVPAEEDCAQVGTDNYRERAREECKRFIALIRSKLGLEPFGARLCIQWNPHDFGSYAEVVCKYNADDEVATAYAFRAENEAPTRWED